MLEPLRGRSMAHVGCTVGLLLGMLLGLFGIMGILILSRADNAGAWAVVAFFAIVVSLGALGYAIGGRIRPGMRDAGDGHDMP